MKIILVPCAGTEWRDERRLMGRVALDPSPQGVEVAAQWLPMLRLEGVAQVLYAPDELSAQMAGYLAKNLGVSYRRVAAFDEVDVGLWAGLTEDDLRGRYETCHRSLCDSPLNVTPPNGESLSDAADRIRTALERRVSKNGVPAVAIVMRPLALALARSILTRSEDSETIWTDSHEINSPVVIDMNAHASN
jgi:broad specificity phosphatase PhoE